MSFVITDFARRGGRLTKAKFQGQVENAVNPAQVLRLESGSLQAVREG